MSQRLPSLHLLRIFETSARRASFKAAAEELHLTPSAVSHQVKALEEQLEFKLFNRYNRRIELTAAGRALQGEVSQAFQRLETGVRRVGARYGRPGLRVTTIAAVASSYLIPRLGEFQQRYPDVDLRIETAFESVDLRHEDIDLGLRIGTGGWPGVIADKLFDLSIAPVVSPQFANEHELSELHQLDGLPLIGLPNMGDVWAEWAAGTGHQLEPHSQRLGFSTYESAISAARQGLGVALAILPLQAREIANGELVMPFDCIHPWRHGFYAVYRPDQAEREVLHSFIEWCVNAIRQSADSIEFCSLER